MDNKKPALGGPIYLITINYLFHRAFAAFLAISDLCSGLSFSALDFPPTNPPFRLSAFFPDNSAGFSISPVACLTTSKAVWVKSLRLLVGVLIRDNIA